MIKPRTVSPRILFDQRYARDYLRVVMQVKELLGLAFVVLQDQ